MGLLRALGLRGRQVVASIVLEVVSLVVVLIGAVAVPMGTYHQLMPIRSRGGQVFAIRWLLSPGDVALSLALLCGAALCASYWPARQANRVDVLAALHYE